MVDVTQLFRSIVNEVDHLSQPGGANRNIRNVKDSEEKELQSAKIAAIIPKSIDLLKSLCGFERLLGNIVEEYVGYHSIVAKSGFKPQVDVKSSSVQDEKKDFDKEFALFISTFAGEVNELREYITNEIVLPELKERKQHAIEIVKYLFNRLNRLSTIIQAMQKERTKCNVNPFKLFSSREVLAGSDSLLKLENKRHRNNSTNKDTNAISKIADRYEGEIAAPTKMKEYSNVASKYKVLLMKEAKELQVQYSEDIKRVKGIEESVERVASMLSEFVRILHTQSDQVDGIFESSEVATESVKKSNTELQTTIDRSQSQQWNMVILAVTLGIILLLLDRVTP